MNVRIFLPMLLVLLLGASACSTTQQVDQETREAPNRSGIVVNNPLSLADFLIRVPGVFVDERFGTTRVLIRGQRPLYVINGMPIGRSYWEANNLVHPNDIKTVEVLRGIDATTRFGSLGGGGAIVIYTY